MTKSSPPIALRTASYGRVFAIFTLMAILIPVLTGPGIKGCPAWPALRELPSFAKGLVEILVFVPSCNGVLAYIVTIAAAAILYRRITAALLSLVGCVLAEMAYRFLLLGDTQWAVLMPLWKFIAGFSLSTPILITLFFFRKK